MCKFFDEAMKKLQKPHKYYELCERGGDLIVLYNSFPFFADTNRLYAYLNSE